MRQVKVKEPFTAAFPEIYIVAQETIASDGQAIVYLEGIDSAFSPEYLEEVG